MGKTGASRWKAVSYTPCRRWRGVAVVGWRGFVARVWKGCEYERGDELRGGPTLGFGREGARRIGGNCRRRNAGGGGFRWFWVRKNTNGYVGDVALVGNM
ncbi:hypothetical protein BHE74_00035711 [Ensete ventricosum]|nr:hypothetical protein BHE74_00035711 [Ensete ventricosum]